MVGKYSPYIYQSDDIKIFLKFHQNISFNWAKGTNDVTPKTSNGHNFGLDYRRPIILYIFGIRSSGSNQLLQLHLCLTNLIFLFALKEAKFQFYGYFMSIRSDFRGWYSSPVRA